MSDIINNYYYFLLLIIFVLIFALIFQKIRFAKIIRLERQDAIKRSKAVINGQTVEQLAPFLPNFPCNPEDAKFLGKPIDFIAFKGLSNSDEIEEILFIEVKTGESKLSKRENKIKKAIEKGKISYVEWRF